MLPFPFPLLLLPILLSLTTAQDDTDPPPLPVVSISISTAKTYQTISGFGISEAFNRAGSIYHLPPTSQQKVLDLLFNNTIGAGLTILRNGIGSSNETKGDYMMSIEPDPPLDGVATYVWNGNDSSQVWLSEKAKGYGVDTFYANAWSAPWFMKSNGDDREGGFLCGVGGTSCGSGDWKVRFAEYLVRYLRGYREVGVEVTHLGFLNEPDVSQPYASMLSNGTQALDFLRILRPTLDSNNFSSVQIICCDNTGWSKSSTLLHEIQSGNGEQYLSIFSSHGYSSPPTSAFHTSLPTWQTEWADLSTPWTTAWDSATNTTDPDTGDSVTTDGTDADGLVWAGNIQDSLVKGNVSAFLHWLGAEEGSGSGMLIRINSTNTKTDGKDGFEVSKRLWAFAHWGRWVRPGSQRVFASSSESESDGSVGVSAFLSRDVGRSGVRGISVQVLNKGWGDVSVSMTVEGAREGGVVTPWITNERSDLVAGELVAVREGVVNATVAARSLVSFVFT